MRFIFCVFALALLAGGCDSGSESTDGETSPSDTNFFSEMTGESRPDSVWQRYVADAVASYPADTLFVDPAVRSELQEQFRQFYAARRHTLAWRDETPLGPTADTLLTLVRNAPLEGLSPNDYHLSALLAAAEAVEQQKQFTPEALVRYDFLHTAAFLTMARHLKAGRVAPGDLREKWYYTPSAYDYAAVLRDGLAAGDVAEAIHQLRPQNPQYALLRRELTRLLSDRSPLPTAPLQLDSLPLRPGDRHPGMQALRQRLRTRGFAVDTADTSTVYDATTAAALARLQKRYGIKPDSVVGEDALTVLNFTADDLIQKLALNLERLRWQPLVGGDYAFVNIPSYQLTIYRDGKPDFESAVVVGESFEHQTPVFSDTMTYLVLNPTWTVPLSIGGKEILPKLQKDPSWAERNGYQVYDGWSGEEVPLVVKTVKWKRLTAEDFRYRVVQQPSDRNALGRVKFIFPNEMSIYLHDTPTKYLFARTERDFSHGCVRVARATDLACYLLRAHQDWDDDRVAEVLLGGETHNVVLPEKLPVHITYQTAWVDPTTEDLYYYPDVYGYDASQLNHLRTQNALLL